MGGAEYVKKMKLRDEAVLLLSGILGLLIFYVIPFLLSFYYTLIDNQITKNFVGMRNFIDLLTNGAFFPDSPVNWFDYLFGFHTLDFIFNDKTRSESQKIDKLNEYTRALILNEQPNIILMEAPDAVMRFSDMAVNGHGILSYMQCQAIPPDYFVFTVSFEFADANLINDLDVDFQTRLGSPINAVSVSNMIFDSMKIQVSHEISCLYSNINHVNQKIKSEQANTKVPLFNINEDYGAKLYACLKSSFSK